MIEDTIPNGHDRSDAVRYPIVFFFLKNSYRYDIIVATNRNFQETNKGHESQYSYCFERLRAMIIDPYFDYRTCIRVSADRCI